tara:strand:+ start:42 stop:1736 length:1695 start_codon:yes stop_codon:yes gene_type:complete
MGLAAGSVATTCHISSSTYNDHLTLTRSGESFKFTISSDNLYILDNDGHQHWLFADEGYTMLSAGANATWSTLPLTVQATNAEAAIGTDARTAGYDSVMRFRLVGTTKTVIGIDDSDGDKFKIAPLNLGTDDMLAFDSAANTRIYMQGSLTAGLYLDPGSTGDAHIEVGYTRSGNGNAYIDLIGDTTYTDYGLRLIRGNAGANTVSELDHRGTGSFSIKTVDAASLVLATSNTTRMSILSDGKIAFGAHTPSVQAHFYATDFSALFQSANGPPYITLLSGYDTHYGWIEWKKSTGATRGGYFGWGTPGTHIELTLEDGNDLAISGGNVIIGAKSAAGSTALLEIYKSDLSNMVIRSATEAVGTQAYIDFVTGSGGTAVTNLTGRVLTRITQVTPSTLRSDMYLCVNTGDTIESFVHLDGDGNWYAYPDDLYLGYDIDGAAWRGVTVDIHFAADATIRWNESNDCFRTEKPFSSQCIYDADTGATSGDDLFHFFDPIIPATGDYVQVSGGGVVYADPDTYIFAYAQRLDPDTVRLFGISTAGTNVEVDADDGGGTLFVELTIAAA